MRRALSCLMAAGWAGLCLAQTPEPVTSSTPVPPPAALPVPLTPQGLTLSSGLVMDVDSGRLLWAKEIDARRFPASTTKMITALVLLERTRPEDIVKISPEAAAVKGSGLGLKKGQKYTMATLLKAILLRSANDACVAAAVHTAGSVPKFVELMNKKAAEVGATSTRFMNPHGLHDPLHYSSAKDLATIALAAMKDPEFRRIVGTHKAMLGPIGETPKEFVSTNSLFKTDPTIKGIKTGWTNPAGRCFVGWHEKDGMRLLTVVLGTKKWQTDQAALMDWFWKSYERAVMADEGQALADLEVPGAVGGPVRVYALGKVEGIVRRGRPAPRITLHEGIQAPLAPGQVIGEADFGDGFKTSVTTDRYVPSRLQMGGLAAGGFACIGAAFFGARARRPRRR